MIEEERESDLRNLFQELRRQEESLVPPFKKLWLDLQRSKSVANTQLRWSFALIIVILLTISLYVGDRVLMITSTRPKESLSLTDWRAPTDFLLQTPGSEVLKSTPDFGLYIPEYQLQAAHDNGVQQ